MGRGGVSQGKGYEVTGMGVGVGSGQEQRGREREAELTALRALVPKSVAQEPEEAQRPQLPGGPVCLSPSGQTSLERGPNCDPLPHLSSVTTLAFPGPFLSPPAGQLHLSPEAQPHGRPALLSYSWPTAIWSPAKHHQL